MIMENLLNDVNSLTAEETAEEEKELQRLFEKDNFVPKDKDPFHLDDDEIEVGPFGWG